MKEVQIPAKQDSQKKAYVAPKLTTHGDVAKLTQSFNFPIGPIAPGSNLFWK
jgi:hypothetical protein